MPKAKFVDYRIRPKGSPEVAYDPFLIVAMHEQSQADAAVDKERAKRVVAVYNFIVKTALEILPPKQREIFYSVWVRSGGRLSKGVMEFSRKADRSHYTSYNSYYKAIKSVTAYLDKNGYTDHIISYLNGDIDDLAAGE